MSKGKTNHFTFHISFFKIVISVIFSMVGYHLSSSSGKCRSFLCPDPKKVKVVKSLNILEYYSRIFSGPKVANTWRGEKVEGEEEAEYDCEEKSSPSFLIG